MRTNLWLVPAIEAIIAVGLFGVTHGLDRAVYSRDMALPSWVVSGTADTARQILTTIAAALITVVGIVFSITIVALTLASTQFGPRMLRNFIRDRGTQVTLGTFVATFLYAVMVLVSIGPGPHGDFVPHLSVTVALVLTVADLAVLIYFINHIATAIQLPQVIAAVAADLSKEIDAQSGDAVDERRSGPSVQELLARISEAGAVVHTPRSGYLQFIRHETLVRIATDAGAVIHLPYRPGHFLVRGHVLAYVWPAEASGQVAEHLEHGHVTGPYRTLTQDVSFAVDQLVEIALRALSPAVNDTFTALTCIDWLSDGLCRITTEWQPQRIRRDRDGLIRLITYQPEYDRLVQRAFEKVRQASGGMPAVMIRQLDALAKILGQTAMLERRQVLLDQAAMIHRASLATVPEAGDRKDVHRRYQALLDLNDRLGKG
ncbi:putative membrane protein [Rhodococcus sp. LBL1]|nr:putative membrane protein [Rhodococcus sp. LBL1]MDH6684972.1 putative membrane protein [Rhodococcus sp. LBL2]